MLEFEMDNEDKLIELLKKCTEYYTNSDNLYVLSHDDVDLIKNELNIELNPNIEVSDDIFDNINNLTKNKFPKNSFFNQVGFSPRTGKIKLPFIMGSMNELKEGDLEQWKCGSEFVVSSKLDGVSCGLVYKNGKLVNAYSRGNGIEGQEILRHIWNLNSIPKEISNKNNINIRGELIVRKNDIENMLNDIEEETGKRLKNGRNSVAGYVNSKQGSKSIEKYLNFIAYNIIDYQDSEFSMYETLKNEYKFQTPTYKLLSSSEIIEEKMTQLVIDTKTNDDFECDGIIITQNIIQNGYEGFETGTHNPKKSRKYKIGAADNATQTEVEYIEWNISKDGLLKPRVKVKPVNLVGVTITYATGHNYKNIFSKKIGIGSKIIIKRSGDVIPYIQEVIEQSDNIPLPQCSFDYDYNDNNEVIDLSFNFNKTRDDYGLDIAVNYMREMNLQKMIYFCSKLNIDFAGEGNLKILTQWFNKTNSNIFTIKDLLKLDKRIFTETIGINGTKLYESLFNKLNDVDECEFMDAVNCFGRGIGELKLKKIYNKYNTLCVNEQQILDTEGWANKTCNQYIEYIGEYFKWKDFIESELNIKFKVYKNELESNKLEHLKVCFTGIRDSNMENFIKRNGGKILSSVSKDCNLLICKSLSDNSTKLKKAKEKNIDIIDYDTALFRILV